uniref:Uncharacterized protein n=1 Tax=Oryza brachyantha TaxID=4533 RepID=J3N7I8_ORYBR
MSKLSAGFFFPVPPTISTLYFVITAVGRTTILSSPWHPHLFHTHILIRLIIRVGSTALLCWPHLCHAVLCSAALQWCSNHHKFHNLFSLIITSLLS